MSRAPRAAALSLLLATFGGCAWSNPDNRPVWNAFEEGLVPEDDGLFYATLPVTVPRTVEPESRVNSTPSRAPFSGTTRPESCC